MKSKIKSPVITHVFYESRVNGSLLVMCDILKDGKFVDCFVYSYTSNESSKTDQ